MFSPLIRYYRDCYEADNRRSTIWNIFKQGVEHRLFIEGEEELLNGGLPHEPVDAEKGRSAMAAAQVYRKEKDLLYCSLFVVGASQDDEGKALPLCAPLLMHPAQFVDREPHVFIRPDLQDRRVNHLLLKHLEPEVDEGSLYERVAGIVANKFLTADEVFDLAALFEATVAHLDVSALYAYPALHTERQLRGLFKAARENALQVVPASCVGLVKKSIETRGVLNELAALADEPHLSKPLRVLFGALPNETGEGEAVVVERVPAVLSAAQEHVLHRAAATPVTLLVGPPGTGKSYTIAALALEHLSRGQSVLIASKMNHAVDVVGGKIERALSGETIVMRGGRRHYLRELKRYLQQLTSGVHTAELAPLKHLGGLEKAVKKRDRQIASLERQIDKLNRHEMAWGRTLMDHEADVFQRLRGRMVRWQAQRSNHSGTSSIG